MADIIKSRRGWRPNPENASAALDDVIFNGECCSKCYYAYCREETAIEAAQRLAAGYSASQGSSARVLP